MRERDEHDVDLLAIEHRADVLDAAEPPHVLRNLALVAQEAQDEDADVPAPVEDAQHLGGRLPAAHHDRVAKVVAVTAGEPQPFAQRRAGEADRDDRLEQEQQDDESRVLVPAKHERS